MTNPFDRPGAPKTRTPPIILIPLIPFDKTGNSLYIPGMHGLSILLLAIAFGGSLVQGGQEETRKDKRDKVKKTYFD